MVQMRTECDVAAPHAHLPKVSTDRFRPAIHLDALAVRMVA
jgi:hypothetical protein